MAFLERPELLFFVLDVHMILLRVTWMMKSNRFSSKKDTLLNLSILIYLNSFYPCPHNFVLQFHQLFDFLICSQIMRLPIIIFPLSVKISSLYLYSSTVQKDNLLPLKCKGVKHKWNAVGSCYYSPKNVNLTDSYLLKNTCSKYKALKKS